MLVVHNKIINQGKKFNLKFEFLSSILVKENVLHNYKLRVFLSVHFSIQYWLTL